MRTIHCDWCAKEALYSQEHPGCTLCGGSDCGDSYDIEYFCLECAVECGLSLASSLVQIVEVA